MLDRFFLPYLLEVVLSASLILVVARVLAIAFRNASASLRHALWLTAFAGILVVSLAPLAPTRISLAIVEPPTLQPRQVAPHGRHLSRENPAAGTQAQPDNLMAPLSTATPGGQEYFLAPMLWTSLPLWIWASGFGLLMLKLFVSLFRVRQMAKQGKPPADEKWAPLVMSISRELGLRKIVEIRLTQHAISPMTFGFRTPIVLLPQEANAWSEERLRVVLAHELAHIARGDFQALIAVQLICASHWFNPLVWAARKHLIREREQSCDDAVLRQGTKASVYANHLLNISTTLHLTGGKKRFIQSVPMGKPSQLEGRLMAILNSGHRRGRLSPVQWFLLLGVFTLLVLPLSAFSPWKPVEDPYADLAYSPGGNRLTQADLNALAARGVDGAYIDELRRLGYHSLTFDQVISMSKVLRDPSLFSKNLAGIDKPLKLIEDKGWLCMRVDQLMEHPTVEITIDGKRYFAMPSCSTLLLRKAELRLAVDPLTGEVIDKGEAVAAIGEDEYIYYFSSRENLVEFNARIR